MLNFSVEDLRKCPPGFKLSGPHCFHLGRSTTSLDDILLSCSTLGAINVKIESAEKDLAVRRFLEGETDLPLNIFIGLSDKVGDNQLSSYRWEQDMSNLTYRNFANGEPGHSSQKCVGIKKTNFKWYDFHCSQGFPALCEWYIK